MVNKLEMHSIGHRRILVSRGLVFITLVTAIVVLAGWFTHTYTVVTLSPTLPAMRANAALCFVLLALSFLSLKKASTQRLAKLLALTVMVVATLTLVETLFHLNFGIDEWLVKDPLFSSEAPGQMSTPTAASFILISLGVLVIRSRYVWMGQSAALLAFVIGVSVSISFPFSIATHDAIVSITGIALHTALLLVAMSIVLMLELPYSRWLNLFFSTNFLGRQGRWVLLAILVLPFLIGWVTLYSSNRGMIGPSLGAGIFVGVFLLLLILMLDFFGSIASRDPLTQLYNRDFFEQSLNKSLTWVKLYGENGAVLYLDLDKFKTMNDLLGHATGDLMLRRIADSVKPTLRKADVFARMGGDEFAVLLPNTTEKDAKIVANRILDALNQVALDSKLGVRVSASIGIAIFPRDSVDPDVLVHLADKAMYRVKEKGSHGVGLAGDLGIQTVSPN